MLNKLTGLLRDGPAKTMRRHSRLVDRVNELADDFRRLDDAGLASVTGRLREQLERGRPLDELRAEAFAAVRESTERTIGDRQFDVQIVGAAVLHEGAVAEMKTGEGKTYVAPLVAYLNALPGQGVHVVTVNDYLARRDRDWMGPVLERLGMKVGVIAADMEVGLRRQAYASDVTYGTNNEIGFDYLRDNMVQRLGDRVQRGLNFAIVDEVDNILIDEARTPLIISGQIAESTALYQNFAAIVSPFREERDYEIDLKQRAVYPTDEAIDKVERRLRIKNIYAEGNYQLLHYLQQALRAKALYHRGRDYVLYREGAVVDARDVRAEIVIVDEFTGRLMHGRRFGEGLHQAIEAKEQVQIQAETRTMATITFQNLFRAYAKLAGMTGTAKTEEEELHKIYGLQVREIPTNAPMVRRDHTDLVYKTKAAKNRAVVAEIARLNEQQRPVLVGTTSIESSEHLGRMLRAEKIPHQLLNARFHAQEAEIVAEAGQPGAVTIATNMAGRGTDIKLGPGVSGLGGLFVLGTERHESRRIDNQLRGRSGRQGDPGESRFFVSLEDDLMLRFRSDRVAGVMERLGISEDVPIENKIITRSIESAQSRVESQNFDIRRHVVEFDDVINRQRQVVYRQRGGYLDRDLDPDVQIREMLTDEIAELVEAHELDAESDPDDIAAAARNLTALLNLPEPFDWNDLVDRDRSAITSAFELAADSARRAKFAEIDLELLPPALRWIMVQTLDLLWVEHLTGIEELRQGIGLVSIGQQNPLVEFRRHAFALFGQMQDTLRRESLQRFFRLQPAAQVARESVLTNQTLKTGRAVAPADRAQSQARSPGPNRSQRRAARRRARRRSQARA
jgi:preprotein translocase subunit SecA